MATSYRMTLVRSPGVSSAGIALKDLIAAHERVLGVDLERRPLTTHLAPVFYPTIGVAVAACVNAQEAAR